MEVEATKFKQNFGHFSSLIRTGAVDEIIVTRRGIVDGVYSRPKRSASIPFIGITTKDLAFTRDELNER